MKTFFLVFSVLIQFAFAIPEKDFKETWLGEVLPYFNQAQQRTFINKQGMKLNYYSLTALANKKTIVILPGRTEPAIKYAELVYDLKNLGFNFYILDHQGQGASDRLLKDSHKGYVEHFNDYVVDFSGFLDEVVIPETQNHTRYLIAHSMGGTISALYLANGKDTFKKAVLSCPMMEVNTKPYEEAIGRLLTTALVAAGQGTKYAPDRGPYIPENDTFEKNEVTHSVARFDLAKYIFVTAPELTLGGPTNRWVNQSLKATKGIDALASKIKVPVLMFQAGMDLIVKPNRQTSFCNNHPQCKLIHFSGAHHEVLQEKDSIRQIALREIRAFIQ